MLVVRSLRARLLVWYTAILAVVIALFGGTVCYAAWRSRLAMVDARLTSHARLLADALQPAPDGTFDLVLPRGVSFGAAADEQAMYHSLWTAAGDLIDRSDAAATVPRPAGAGARTRHGRREVTVAATTGAVVLAGLDLAPIRRDLWSLAGLIATVGLGALAISLAGGWLLVGRALAPLHASLERQRRFTADASHELRTPLTAISTETQWVLARERTPEQYRESLETCQRAVARMESVVTRLLALARAEAHADGDRAVPVRLDDVVRRAVSDLTPLTRARGLTVTLTTPPTVVTGDPDRLLEAVSHVVTNAVHYNVDRGSVRISLGRDGDRAVLEVADTGVGIAGEDLGRVFEPFFRADPARGREAGGAGLGLAVARAIVRRHGGDITCDSRLHVGTAVVLRLPCPAATS